jgi:hypothetical protein
VLETSNMTEKVESSHSMRETQTTKIRKKNLKTKKNITIFQIVKWTKWTKWTKWSKEMLSFYAIQKHEEKIYPLRACCDARGECYFVLEYETILEGGYF